MIAIVRSHSNWSKLFVILFILSANAVCAQVSGGLPAIAKPSTPKNAEPISGISPALRDSGGKVPPNSLNFEELLKGSERERLRSSVVEIAPPQHGFSNVTDSEKWLTEMSRRLEHHIPRIETRLEFLRVAQYEAARAGLDPQLVLALIQVKSQFRKYAISRSGARGYMQVMPFWINLIGRKDDNLFNLRSNLRYGCVILRHYLELEGGNVYRALDRYNGSPGQSDFSELVDKTMKE